MAPLHECVQHRLLLCCFIQILPDSGHMALMEGGVDLAAIMTRSGLLSAGVNSHEVDQRHGGSERGREQRASAREAGNGSVQQCTPAVGAMASGVKGAGSSNGAIAGTVGSARAASSASAMNGRSVVISLANGAVTVPALAANGATASNGALSSAAPALSDSQRSSNGSSGPTSSNGAGRAASGSPSVDGSGSVPADEAGSNSRSEHNVEVGAYPAPAALCTLNPSR